MCSKTDNLCFLATGIGSVPFLDLEKTCANILDLFPEIPFWPQFVKRSYMEDMNIQFTERLPLVEIDEKKKAPFVPSTDNMETKLIEFYDHFFADDLDYFAMSKDFAPGLFKLVELVTQNHREGAYIKGQVVGPVTFAGAVSSSDGKSILHDPNLLEPVINGLSIKAAWQVKILSQTRRQPILFLDEPYLSGFGSAFSPIERDQVIDILGAVISYINEKSSALIGIHCCGNTDWAMLLDAGPHIINFDASDYMEYFLLYKDSIKSFLHRGGIIAWGIVPTASFTGLETVDQLFSKLQNGINTIISWGIEPEVIYRQSLLTPACGLGTMEPDDATKAMDLLAGLSKKCRTEFNIL